MRAVVVDEVGTFEVLPILEVPVPVCGPGELLIEIHATAVNYVDMLLIGGKHQVRPDLPFIPGKGPAGIVRQTGAGVADFSPGDRVVAMCEPGGGYAELISTPATQCYRLPDSMNFTDAACMALVFDTAWLCIRERGRYREGETILVLGGSGGVGLAAIQLGKALGAYVLAGISNPDKRDLVEQAGADAVIDLSRAGLRDSLRAQVFEVTDGRGADIVIDPLGDDIFDAALRALAWRGRYVVIGFAAGRIPSVKANYILVRNIDICGLQIADYRKRTPEITAECFAELFALYVAGRIGPLPVTILPLEGFEDALRAIRDRNARGRIVLVQDRPPA